MHDLFDDGPFHRSRDGRTVRTVWSNAFRMTPDGSLDRPYLRTCAIYRLLKNGRIDKRRAIEIAPRLTATIEIWLNGPLKGIAR